VISRIFFRKSIKPSNTKSFTDTDDKDLTLQKSARELVRANLQVAEYKLSAEVSFKNISMLQSRAEKEL